MKRVFTHIGFSVAVTLLVLNLIELKYVYILTAGLAVLFAASLAVKKYRQAMTLPICFGSAVFTCLVYLCVYNSAVIPALSLVGNEADASFYITDLPAFSNNKYVYTVKTAQIVFNGAPQTIKLRLVSETPINAPAYQLINARLEFHSLGKGAFNSFGYWSDSVYVSANLKSYSVTNQSVFSPLKYILILRNDIIETFMERYKMDLGAVSAALVTGDKYYLSDDIKNNFRLAGASHILAVSGLHLGVITGSVLWLFRRIGVNRKVTAVSVILLSLLYMSLASFTASVVRAGIMVCVLFAGEFFDRKADSLNSLGIAVFIMCLNPFAVGDMGAVLSVLSVLSLITVYPLIKSKFDKLNEKLSPKRHKVLNVILRPVNTALNGVIVAFSVFIITLPACLVFFNYYALCGLISNVVIVPLGSAATVLSFITYISCKLNFLSGITVFLSEKLNLLLINITGALSSLKFLTVPFSDRFYLVIAGVLLIFAVNFIVFKNRTFKVSIYISLIFIIISLAINTVWQYNNSVISFIFI